MARAGFTAIHSGRIRSARTAAGTATTRSIPNKAICRLYASAMTIDDDGVARLQLGEDKAQVDDRGHAVGRDAGRRRSRRAASPSLLNDETREPLDPATLRVGADHVLYCRVKGGRHEARFLRPAYYELMRHAVAGPDGALELPVGGAARPARLTRARRPRRPRDPAEHRLDRPALRRDRTRRSI